MRAERVGEGTLLAQIVRMVSEAQRSRAPIQRLADKVSAWFVPTVVLVAVLAFAAWALIGPDPRFGNALVTAVSVLIMALIQAGLVVGALLAARKVSALTRRLEREIDPVVSHVNAIVHQVQEGVEKATERVHRIEDSVARIVDGKLSYRGLI